MNPSLYEMLTLTFGQEQELHSLSEPEQLIHSIIDNISRILNCRAGTLAHLPNYGLPDLNWIKQGLPGSAHILTNKIKETLLAYEPRLISVKVHLHSFDQSGYLHYRINAWLQEVGLVCFRTELGPENHILVNQLKE